MKRSLSSIIVLCIFLYFIGYYNSSYWDPNLDWSKQPLMLQALGLPWIVLFLYFLFGKVLINEEAIYRTKVFSSDNIFMSAYMSFMYVGYGWCGNDNDTNYISFNYYAYLFNARIWKINE